MNRAERNSKAAPSVAATTQIAVPASAPNRNPPATVNTAPDGGTRTTTSVYRAAKAAAPVSGCISIQAMISVRWARKVSKLR